MCMKVEMIVPSISAVAGGPSYSVPGLCRGLCACGIDATLHCLAPLPEAEYTFKAVSYQWRRLPHLSLGRSPDMYNALIAVARHADILHNNSLWMLPNVYAAWATMRAKRYRRDGLPKLVNAPRGTLAEWSLAKSRWRKKFFGLLWQDDALRHTDMWHATCVKEYDEIRHLGYRQPVAIVPIGIDIPKIGKIKNSGRRTVGFFGRIHKVKGVDRLLSAWADIATTHPDWELAIAGADCGAKEELVRMIKGRRIPRVRFVGALYGQDKFEFLASLELYVLPSYTENFAVTVAEALVCKTPCIASTGSPWKGLVDNGAGWWVANDVETLARTLNAACRMSKADLSAMGEKGYEWMSRDFAWQSIGDKMKEAYSWLLGKGVKPEFVIED